MDYFLKIFSSSFEIKSVTSVSKNIGLDKKRFGKKSIEKRKSRKNIWYFFAFHIENGWKIYMDQKNIYFFDAWLVGINYQINYNKKID